MNCSKNSPLKPRVTTLIFKTPSQRSDSDRDAIYFQQQRQGCSKEAVNKILLNQLKDTMATAWCFVSHGVCLRRVKNSLGWSLERKRASRSERWPLNEDLFHLEESAEYGEIKC